MTEVSLDSDYSATTQLVGNERVEGKIRQWDPRELSPIDFKTQALLTFFLGGLGISDFYAGNTKIGLGKLALSIISRGTLVPIISGVSLIHLCLGKYVDDGGKVIRQVVQLKKEEMSTRDQTIATLLCFFLGWAGAHQFYTGKPLKGVLMLCSLGGLGVWWYMNLYQLVTCDFKDGDGKTICPDYIKL